ncbi:MAG: MotA/TolQ/ExbB proton channel family protein [Mariniblastus sp.]
MNLFVYRRSQLAIALGFILIATCAIGSSNSTSASQFPKLSSQAISASPLATASLATATLTQDDEAEGSDPNPAPAPAKRGINFLSLLTQGGWFMIPLLLLSLGVVTIGIERYLALRREKVFPPELIDQLSSLSQSPGGLDPRRAYQACQRYPSSASYVLRSMLVKVGRPQSEMEHAVGESSQREATRLAQMTSWLSLAAAIAPLIGLLGTVWGITQAFYDTTQLAELNAGQNRGVALANGIYVALVTTMVGLMIAIPAAILSHFYENRIVQLMNEIEEMVFNLLPQFERYEGQVRFTQGLANETGEDSTGFGSDGSSGENSNGEELAESGTGKRRKPTS